MNVRAANRVYHQIPQEADKPKQDMVGRKTKYFVCVKKDIGYFESVGYPPTPPIGMIEQFILKEMGMSNVINAAKAEYKTVGFYAVSALRDQSSVDGLFKDLLNKRNVSI